MSDDATGSILHRMTAKPEQAAPAVPLTVSRAVRLAVTRAAQTRIALTLQVSSIAESLADLDGVLAELNGGSVILALGEGAGDAAAVSGVVVCDPGLCAAAVEMLTTGRVSPKPVDERAVTRADVALISPFLSGLLEELGETTPRTALDGWVDDIVLGRRLADARATGFVLSEQTYRIVHVAIALAGGERQGSLMLALPTQGAMVAQLPNAPAATPTVDWRTTFQAAVLDAPAALDAVLHQFDLPLAAATSLDVGQILPLHGCTVGTVRLVAPDGRLVARAKLGQVAGQIAVRVEDARPMEMRALATPGGGEVDLQMAVS